MKPNKSFILFILCIHVRTFVSGSKTVRGEPVEPRFYR
jgi:hypothetical protein